MLKCLRQLNALALLPALLLAVSVARADDSASRATKPQVTVTERTFDFGRAPQGVKIAHGFWLKNTGGDTLRIDDVKPSCGCTKAPLEKTVLAVGDSTMVNVIFSTGHYNSPVHKTASIRSNAAGPVPLIDFTAEVHRAMDSINTFRVDPYLVNLDDNWQDITDDQQELEITVRNVANTALSFHLVAEPQNHVRVNFPDGMRLGPDETKTFTIAFDPGMADDLFNESLTLEASVPSHTRITIPIVKARRWGPAPLSQR